MSMAMLKHPAGTNHFQFRCNQPDFGAAVTDAGCASMLSCNWFTGAVAIFLSKERAVPAAFKRLDGSHCACATTPSGPAALAGTWTNALGTVWTINADGTFHVVGSAPRREIWGTFTIAGDTITIQETRRLTPIPKECKKPGVYKFSRPDSNTLAFVLVTDTCKPRVQNVTQTWHRK